MIVWCPRCETNPLENTARWEPWCAECVYGGPLPEPEERYPYTLESISMLIDRYWVSRTHRIEFNTVDLKQLRKDRERRKYVTMRGRFG